MALYYQLRLARSAEEAIRAEYAKDEMKTPVHLGIGQEAIPVGVCHAVPRGTRMFGTYRNHALYLALTQDTDGFFAELYGKATGPGKGKAGSMHLSAPAAGLMATSAVVGTTIPLAVGAALAHAYRGVSDLVVSFFGDGAVEEGVFWESLNFACLKQLRVLFVCEDNDLAIHTPSHQRQGFRSIPEAVAGLRCHVSTGEGNDVFEVIAKTRELLRRMEAQPQPAFLHLRYLRMLEHVGIHEDFDAGYRARPDAAERAAWDPLARCESHLTAAGCTKRELADVHARVEAQIARSLRTAQQAPFAPVSEMHTDVWA